MTNTQSKTLVLGGDLPPEPQRFFPYEELSEATIDRMRRVVQRLFGSHAWRVGHPGSRTRLAARHDAVEASSSLAIVGAAGGTPSPRGDGGGRGGGTSSGFAAPAADDWWSHTSAHVKQLVAALVDNVLDAAQPMTHPLVFDNCS